MQLSPLAANRLVSQHDVVGHKIDGLLKGSGYTPGILYINGAAWVMSIHKAGEKPVEIVADVGDVDMLLAKIGAFV